MSIRIGGLAGACAAAAALACAAGCGGGGGSKPGLSIRADRASVTLAGNQGAPLIEARVTVTLSGTPDRTIYVGASVVGQGIAQTEVVLYDDRAELRVVADTSLPAGTYAGTIVGVACWDGACERHLGGSPLHIPYTLTLAAVPALSAPGGRTLVLGASTAAAELAGSVPVTLNVGPVLAWSASSSAPWLVLDTASGQTGTALAWHVDPAALAAWSSGIDREATVSLEAPSAPWLTASFRVAVQNRLPEVRFAGPARLVAGRPGRAFISGFGFDQVSDAGLAAMLGDLPGATLTRLGDRALRVELAGAPPPGRFPLRLGNALGVPRHESALELVAPSSYPAAALELPGEKGALLHDAARRALWFANVTEGAVYRLAFDAGTKAWITTSRPVPGVLELALAPDASVLVAVAPNQVSFLDPDTLAERGALPGPGFQFWPAGLGAPVTNDGRVWLSVGAGTYHDLYTLDLVARTLTKEVVAGASLGFYLGPWGMASRDGERLLLVQTSGLTPAPPMLYLDSTVGTFRTDSGLDFWYQGALDDDGSRAILSGELFDGAFASMGFLELPADTFARGWFISPDGTRGYALAAPYPGYSGLPPSRLSVYDAATGGAAGARVAAVGEVAILADVTCSIAECYGRASGALAPDGRTLFLAGNERVVIVPLP